MASVHGVSQNFIDPVTLDVMEKAVMLIPCGHSFGQKSVTSLVKKYCPVCRKAFREYVPNYAVRSEIADKIRGS